MLQLSFRAHVLRRRSVPLVNPKLSRFPKVSVLLTVHNLDDGLEENIVSVLSSDYPGFDVFFTVDSLEEPCVPVIHRAMARFLHIRSTIVPTGHSESGNPKIHKLSKLETMTNAPLTRVLDSDTRVFPRTLAALVQEHVRSGASIVFSPIRCNGARTLGSILEMSAEKPEDEQSALLCSLFPGPAPADSLRRVGKEHLFDGISAPC